MSQEPSLTARPFDRMDRSCQMSIHSWKFIFCDAVIDFSISTSKQRRHAVVIMKLKPGWILAVAAFIHLTVTYGTISSFVVLFVSLEEEFESSAVATGWMGSMAWGIASLFSPFSAMMFLRWGHRPIACLGVLCCTVGLLVTSFLSNLWYMYVSFGFVFAAGTNMLNNACFHLIALHFPGKKGVRPFALVSLSGGVALLAGTALLDVCIKALGWRISYGIFSGIIFVVCLPLCYFYKQPSPCNSSTNVKEENYTQLKADSPSMNKKDIDVDLEEQPVRSSSFVCLASATYGCESTHESRTETNTDCKYKQLEDENKTKVSCLGMKVLFRNFQRRHHADAAPDRPVGDESKTLNSEDTSCSQKRTANSSSGNTSGEVEHVSTNATFDEKAMEVSNHIVDLKDESCQDRRCAFVKVPGVWMATFGTLTTTVASVFNVINLVSYMQMIEIEERISVLLIMGLGLAEIFGRILFFLIGSSLPVAGITTMAGVNLAGAALSLCLALVPKLATIIVYIVVAGMARGIFYTINLPSCLELFKGLDSAVVITLMMVGNGLGGLFSSTCAGLSVDMTGSYKAAFFTCTGLYFTSFLLFGSLSLWPRMFVPDKPSNQTHHRLDDGKSSL